MRKFSHLVFLTRTLKANLTFENIESINHEIALRPSR